MITEFWMQKASAALMLATLVTGQPVFADADAANTATETVVEPIVVAAPPTVQDVLLSVCEANGYGEDCAKTLLGMLWVESTNVYDAVGDRGLALGYFQIHYRMHGITAACAKDLVCSADWTIQYLERNSYPTYVSYAVQCHNGCNAGNGYSAKALRNGARLWDEPMTVTQDAAIDLAQLTEEATAIAMN